MSISSNSNFSKIYTGSSIEVQRLHTILKENDIKSIVHDDNESARLAGFALGSPDNTRLLVEKDQVVKAKHIIQSALNDFDKDQVSENELDTLAQNTKKAPVTETETDRKYQKNSPREISKGRALFYAGFIVYALWRLYPLLNGEEVPTLRIVISGGLMVFSIVMLIRYFKK